MGILVLLLQLPVVQTFVTGKITNQLSQQLETKVEIEGVDIDFFKKVVLEGVYLEDQEEDTLLYAQRLRVDIGVFALFDKTIVLDEILLENAYVNLYTVDDSATLNFAFIPEAFASDTVQDTTSAAWEFDMHDIVLSNTRVDFNDYTISMEISLGVKEFLVSLQTLGLEESHIKAEAIEIDGLQFGFQQLSQQSGAIDTTEIAQAAPDTTALNPSGFIFTVGKLLVENSHVSFATDTSSTPGKINFANLDLEQLAIAIRDIHIGRNSVLGDIQQVSLLEANSGFNLQALEVDLNMAMPALKAKLTNLAFNNSALNGEIGLVISDFSNPDSLLTHIFLDANFDSTRIGLKDIAFFSPALDSMPDIKSMDLTMAGVVKVDSGNAIINGLEIEIGEGFVLSADALAKDISNMGSAYLDVNIKSLVSDMEFISKLLPPNTLPPSLRQAGGIKLTARAEGYMSDADLIANLTSDLGRASANINYQALNEGDFQVSGEANAYRLNLQAITGNDSLGLATLHTNFDVAMRNDSFSADTLSLILKSLQYNHYTYEDLKVRASFVDSLLLSTIGYEDENFAFNINAEASLAEENSWLTLNGDIDEVDLLKLNLSADSIILSTNLKAEVDNLDPDLMDGYLRLTKTAFIEGASKYHLDTIQLRSKTTDSLRYIYFDSDYVDAALKGNFAFAYIPQMINNFTSYYFTAIQDTAALPPDQYFVLNVDIKEEPMMVRAFMPDLSLPQSSSIYAEYHADNHLVEVDVNIPELHYMDYFVQNLNLAADTENRDNIKFAVTGDRMVVGDDMTVPSFGLEGSFIQDMIQFNVFVANSEEPSYLDFNGFLSYSEDTALLEILESSLAIENEVWNIPNDAIVQYSDQFLRINNFLLTQDDQQISLNTRDEFTKSPKLTLAISQFKIGDVLTVLDMEDYEISGLLNGEANVTNVFTLEEVAADFKLSDLLINAQEAGDLNIEAQKKATAEAVYASIGMDSEYNDFSVEGTYNPVDSVNTLDMELVISKFRLEQWGVFAEEFVTDLSGNIEADIDITGSLNKPVLEGYFAFDPQTVMRLKAIGSLYRFTDERINLTETTIDLNQFVVIDSAKNKLAIEGEIQHTYFQDFIFDLTVTTPEFKFFNAEQKNSPEYYGTVNAATDISITGPLENLYINGEVTTKRGTALVIAIVNDPDFASHAAFINFVNTNAYLAADSIPDSLQVRSSTMELTGITLDLTLHINPQARVEILIDPVTGDKLVAVGEGDIRVEMTPTSGMNIQGTYILERGSYSLSFLGLLKRQFNIREGSKINLVGDPLGARFDITAVYETEANASSLFPQDNQGISQYNVEQPVNVVLNLEGTLEAPEIGFGIELPAISDQYNPVSQRIRMIQDDQTELYKQVFGLIVLNRFIPIDGGFGQGAGGAAVVNERVDASVSSILTTQLSSLTEDYLGGIELSVDLESRDPNEASFANKDLQVQLSKQLFNERLTVTVGGTSSLGGGETVPGNDDSALMGDFEILYRINESGTLNLRIFQTNNRDIFTQQIRQRQGVSVTYVKSFDEIFVSEENKKILRAE